MIKGYSPAAYNPRTEKAERVDSIHRSMKRFGSLDGFVVNRRTGVLISGHQRAKALPEGVEPVIMEHYDSPSDTGTVAEGYVVLDGEKWPYRVVDVSEAVERAMNLAANAQGQRGWDEPKLGESLRAVQAGGESVDDLGFTEREVLDYVDLAERLEAGVSAVVDPPETVYSEPGVIYRLGPHRVMCGDSSKAEDVERLLAGAQPRVTVADPPYVVDFDPAWRQEAGTRKTRRKAWDTPRMRRSFADDPSKLDPGFPDQWRLAPGSVLYVWHSMLHNVAVAEAVKAAGFDPVAYIVWDKGSAVIGRGHWSWRHEIVLACARPDGEAEELFAEPQDGCFYAVRRGKARHWRGGKQPTIWNIPIRRSHDESGGHGAGKPLECYARPIALHTRLGEAAYCPFVGSGSSVLAAESIGRVLFGMEIDPAYVDVIRARWAAYKGEPWPPRS